MIKRALSQTVRLSGLVNRNRYFLLDHRIVQKTKKKMFEHNQKTLWLKIKFIAKEAKYTVVQGSKDLWRDTSWMLGMYRKKTYSQFTAYEKYVSWRIFTDLIKFIPYSIMMIVPFAELLLPVILFLFPNAVPSFYLFDTAEDKRIQKLEKKQQQSHTILIEKLMDILRQEFKKQQQFTHYDFFKKDFFEVIDQLNGRLNYTNFNSDELIHVLNFLGGNFVTGTFIINRIVNIFTMYIPRFLYKLYRFIKTRITKKELPQYQDPFFVKGDFRILQLNYFPFEYFKKQLLLWQIRQHFKHLQNQDGSFQKHGLDDIQGYKIVHFARSRGFPAISCYVTLKNVIKNDWVKITTHPKFTDNTKLWYSVMMHKFLSQTNKDLN